MKVDFIQVVILSCFTLVFFSVKLFAIFQQCGYKIDEYFISLFKNNLKLLGCLSTYSVAFAMLLAFGGWVFGDDKFLFYLYCLFTVFAFCGVYYFKTQVIKPSVITKRFLRIFLTAIFVLCFFVAIIYRLGLILLPPHLKSVAFCVVGLTPILTPFSISLGGIINYPYDFLKYRLSIFRCRKKIDSQKEVIKIGVTGSSGKTTVKEFLWQILSTKYSVIKTPSSYNTPLGICSAVKSCRLNCDIFIAEMGARRKNDIKKLCKIVKPNIGIITGITAQHTQTLKGIEGVKKAKYQLIDGLVGRKVAVFSSDTKESEELYKKANCKKYLVGKNAKRHVYTKNERQEKDGIYFDIVIGGKQYKTFAPLLGLHNLTNICLAVCVGKILGVTDAKILSVIPKLKAPPHRAQLLSTTNGVTVIDDGYNSNIEGVKSTVNAVKVFDGEKIAVTSGIVELGKYSKQTNILVGEILGEVFDEVVVIGKNFDYVQKGIGGKCSVSKVENLEKAKEKLATKNLKGKVVVFFSDLPDRY